MKMEGVGIRPGPFTQPSSISRCWVRSGCLLRKKEEGYSLSTFGYCSEEIKILIKNLLRLWVWEVTAYSLVEGHGI